MKTKRPNRVWVVVHVFGGVPESAEVFRNAASAVRREQRLRKTIRDDYDSLEVFEVKVR